MTLLAVETRLARIAQHRPLDQIADCEQCVKAKQVRNWVKGEFLNVLQ